MHFIILISGSKSVKFAQKFCIFFKYLTLEATLVCIISSTLSYADDIQLYVSFIPNDTTAKVITNKIQECLEEINDWKTNHFLKLNMKKLKFLKFQHQRCFMKILFLKVNSVIIFPKKCAESLGFFYGDKLSLN